MSLKKTTLFCLFIITIIVSSCQQNTKQVESTEAKTITVNKAANAIHYNQVKEGSVINWKATHLGGIDPRIGKIYCDDASILVTNGKVSNASISIDMNKMTVDNIPKDGAEELINHLKTEDFFNVKKHPTSKFELTSLVANEGEYNTRVTGNLTILGISKSITFNANVKVSEKEVAIASEDFAINRADWGMTYNAKGTAGVPLDYLISDEVVFQIAVAFAQ